MTQYEPGPQSNITWLKGELQKLSDRIDEANRRATKAAAGGSGGGVTYTPPTGLIELFAMAAPSGYLACDGSAVSRSTYAALFAAIGTTYGSGDGSSTFNLPNLVDRVAVGAGGSISSGTLGASGGESTHVLSTAELASHNHGISDPGHSHGITDPGHGHGISDPGHAHSVYDPGHSHNANHNHSISDPGHGHGSTTLSGFMTYQTTNATRQRFTVGGSTSPYTIGTRASQIDDINYGTAAGAGTGIGINSNNFNVSGSGTGIGIYSNTTGVTVNGNTTGVSTNGSGTGVTTQANGSGTAHNNLQPYLLLRYAIKT